MAGDLDAAVTWEPWLTQVREAGKGKVLVSTRDHPGLLVDALIVRPELVQRRPAVVRSIVAGLIDAVDFWKANPSVANEIVGRNFSLKAEEVAQMITGVHYLNRDDNRMYLRQQGRASQTLAFAERIWRAAGLITTAPDLSQIVTDEFVK
jgi:NitT/TauT family transport system substrate-binding protein